MSFNVNLNFMVTQRSTHIIIYYIITCFIVFRYMFLPDNHNNISYRKKYKNDKPIIFINSYYNN